VPSIITGGQKSEKIQEPPFKFHYNEFMQKMCDEDRLCDMLFIVGYSFRDDHINSAISKRLKFMTKSINPRPLELIIVDHASTVEVKEKFIKQINSALELEEVASGLFVENDSRILFGGADSIQEIIKN
jgi:hypothetical protein